MNNYVRQCKREEIKLNTYFSQHICIFSKLLSGIEIGWLNILNTIHNVQKEPNKKRTNGQKVRLCGQNEMWSPNEWG